MATPFRTKGNHSIHIRYGRCKCSIQGKRQGRRGNSQWNPCGDSSRSLAVRLLAKFTKGSAVSGELEPRPVNPQKHDGSSGQENDSLTAPWAIHVGDWLPSRGIHWNSFRYAASNSLANRCPFALSSGGSRIHVDLARPKRGSLSGLFECSAHRPFWVQGPPSWNLSLQMPHQSWLIAAPPSR